MLNTIRTTGAGCFDFPEYSVEGKQHASISTHQQHDIMIYAANIDRVGVAHLNQTLSRELFDSRNFV